MNKGYRGPSDGLCKCPMESACLRDNPPSTAGTVWLGPPYRRPFPSAEGGGAPIRSRQPVELRSLTAGRNTVLCVGIQSLVAGLYAHIEQTSLATTCAHVKIKRSHTGRSLGVLFSGSGRGFPERVPGFFSTTGALRGANDASRWARYALDGGFGGA